MVIEDDPHIARMLQLNLSSEGYEVVSATSAAVIDERSLRGVHVVVAAAACRDADNAAFARRLRSSASTAAIGLIVCEPFEGNRAIIDILDAGADDCLAKPYSLSELLARIRALMRRRRGGAMTNASSMTAPRELTLNRELSVAHVGDSSVQLSATEADILAELLRYAGCYTSRIAIFNAVWPGAATTNLRVVDTNISRLRHKLERLGVTIVNRQGLGYMLSDNNKHELL